MTLEAAIGVHAEYNPHVLSITDDFNAVYYSNRISDETRDVVVPFNFRLNKDQSNSRTVTAMRELADDSTIFTQNLLCLDQDDLEERLKEIAKAEGRTREYLDEEQTEYRMITRREKLREEFARDVIYEGCGRKVSSEEAYIAGYLVDKLIEHRGLDERKEQVILRAIHSIGQARTFTAKELRTNMFAALLHDLGEDYIKFKDDDSKGMQPEEFYENLLYDEEEGLIASFKKRFGKDMSKSLGRDLGVATYVAVSMTKFKKENWQNYTERMLYVSPEHTKHNTTKALHMILARRLLRPFGFEFTDAQDFTRVYTEHIFPNLLLNKLTDMIANTVDWAALDNPSRPADFDVRSNIEDRISAIGKLWTLINDSRFALIYNQYSRYSVGADPEHPLLLGEELVERTRIGAYLAMEHLLYIADMVRPKPRDELQEDIIGETTDEFEKTPDRLELPKDEGLKGEEDEDFIGPRLPQEQHTPQEDDMLSEIPGILGNHFSIQQMRNDFKSLIEYDTPTEKPAGTENIELKPSELKPRSALERRTERPSKFTLGHAFDGIIDTLYLYHSGNKETLQQMGGRQIFELTIAVAKGMQKYVLDDDFYIEGMSNPDNFERLFG
ncbi:hypothetical protein JW868_03180 [Candidatus Woesearchaeota archaeon]|nr:hypothetical protein [Candidatus Woesearchaeota archaeon]